VLDGWDEQAYAFLALGIFVSIAIGAMIGLPRGSIYGEPPPAIPPLPTFVDVTPTPTPIITPLVTPTPTHRTSPNPTGVKPTVTPTPNPTPTPSAWEAAGFKCAVSDALVKEIWAKEYLFNCACLIRGKYEMGERFNVWEGCYATSSGAWRRESCECLETICAGRPELC
jgi:hypothetical protein